MRTEDEGCAESLPGTGAEWVVFFHSGEMTPDLQRALDEWRAASAENDIDFRRAETVWRLTGELAEDPVIQAELAVSIAAALLLVSSRGTRTVRASRSTRTVVSGFATAPPTAT